MAITVPPDVYNKILTALWTSGYLTVLMTPRESLNILQYMIHSLNDTSYIAHLTGNAVQDVNKTISSLFACVNSTIAVNDTSKYWKCISPTTTASNNEALNCENLQRDLNSLVLAVLFVLAVIFLLVMSFIEKRKYRLECCHGRPGAVVPVNLLDSYENRFGTALAFGATTADCLNVLIGDVKFVLGARSGAFLDQSPGFVSIFFKMLATIIIAIAAYPLFVCMRTPHKRAGSIFGICYCVLWVSLQGYKFGKFSMECINSATLGSASTNTVAFEALGELPQAIAIIVLLGKFILTLMKAFRRRAEKQGNAEDVYDNFQEGYMFKHVKNLVKPVPNVSSQVDENFKSKLKDKLYKWKPEFKYSTRVVCAFTVSSICLYLLTLLLLYICWFFIDHYLGALSRTEDFDTFVKSMAPNDNTIVQKVRTHLQIWTSCFYVAIILSTIKTVFVYLNMLAWYRGHIMRLRRGDRSWLPSSIKTLSASPSSLVAASMKYAGFQVGYAAWGYLMFALLMWLLLSILISFIFYPLFKGESSPLLKVLYNVWPGLLISLVVAFAQRLAAAFIFLQQRGKIISIDNRNAFNIASYFLFYFNIFLGLISCLLRIIKSVILGVIFLERVQKSLLPRSFEKMDPGYFAYVGYILVEHSHANPVLCVFFYLLRQHANASNRALSIAAYHILTNDFDKLSKDGIHIDEEKQSVELRASKRWRIVRNRWNLAYTLLNNPSLSQLRKQSLKSGQNEDATDEDKETESTINTDENYLSDTSNKTTPVSI